MPRPYSATAQQPNASEEEALLVAAWQDHRDRDGLELLIARYMPRIRNLANRSSRLEREDLVTEGVIALIDAAGRYPKDARYPFGGYAIPAIKGAILSANAGLGTIVSIPERQLRDALSGRMSQDRAEIIRQTLNPEDLPEFAPDDATLTGEQAALERERRHKLRHAVADALRPLGRAERRLVIQHLLHEDVALETLADRLNLSLARARSLEGRALHKMRNTLMKKGFVMSDLT